MCLVTLEGIVWNEWDKRQVTVGSEGCVTEGDYIIILKLQFCLKSMDHCEINLLSNSFELLG